MSRIIKIKIKNFIKKISIILKFSILSLEIFHTSMFIFNFVIPFETHHVYEL